MPKFAFEWDPKKAIANRRKHGVSFDEASTVFDDPFAKNHDDDDHARDEPREILVGRSLLGRLLIVSFTKRRYRLRIISARRAATKERRYYENPENAS